MTDEWSAGPLVLQPSDKNRLNAEGTVHQEGKMRAVVAADNRASADKGGKWR